MLSVHGVVSAPPSLEPCLVFLLPLKALQGRQGQSFRQANFGNLSSMRDTLITIFCDSVAYYLVGSVSDVLMMH